jgi:hypothetical protein
MGLGKFFGSLVGSGVGQFAKDAADVIDRFVETKEEKEAAALLRMKIQQEPDKWQTEINKIEAGHRSMFVAGWRPFIGWICGIGLGMHFVAFPLLEWTTDLLGEKILAPQVEWQVLMTLVLSLLGLGATRTYEKSKGLVK